jgi:hypothetical protein
MPWIGMSDNGIRRHSVGSAERNHGVNRGLVSDGLFTLGGHSAAVP